MPTAKLAPNVRIIVLEKDEHLDKTVRRFQKGWVVRFMRGASLLGCDVDIRTTLTGEKALTWSPGTDHMSVFCDVECCTAGSFRYTFNVDGSSSIDGSGYFLVLPFLNLNGGSLSMDAIVCQTHLTKLLGPLSEWEGRLRVAHESGYNMIHLTPIHELGISNSSYSLSDHQALVQTIHEGDKHYLFDDITALVKKMEKEWHMLTVQDVVWNHAAKNAKWLQEHPESSYNCYNSPHLRPAYVVDRVYHHFGKEVAAGKWEHRGIPKVIENVHHTNAIEYLLRTEVLPKIRLHEFYQINIDAHVEKFVQLAKDGPSADVCDEFVPMVADSEWKRFGCTVDWPLAMRVFNRFRSETISEGDRVSQCAAAFRSHLEFLNAEGGKRAWEVLMGGLAAVMGGIIYERVADHGPYKGLVDEEHPLTTDYFLHLEPDSTWEEEESLAFDFLKSQHLMAFNGWVMSDNPLANFALPETQVYLRRELVCWGDSVKLNYGEKPEDCPYLWNYMKTYTTKCAEMFHGLRIDNAHGTPIHVAEYLILAAREVRPDIYVFAELFTGSEELDNLFVNHLGISSLIREAQAASDSHEQGRLIYRYGGDCMGAMMQKRVRPSAHVIPHGLFLDQSHDNPTPIDTRSVFDLLPTAAMLSMASCAVGSTRGYDELVRHAINVVSEKRPYSSWSKDVNDNQGIIAARRVLNKLHAKLAKEDYTEVFVDQMNPDVVAVSRHNPVTHSTVVVVSHTAFDKHNIQHGRVHLKHIPIGGVLEEIMFEMRLEETTPTRSPESQTVLTGLDNYRVHVREHIPPSEAVMCSVVGDYIEITNLPSGAVIGFKFRLSDTNQTAVDKIRASIAGQVDEVEIAIHDSLSALTLQQFNRLLFCCEAEDQVNIQLNAYDVPNFGKFVYSGLQGLMPTLDHIRINNDLGHPVCANLRDGTWLADFIVDRLQKYTGLEKVSSAFRPLFSLLADVPYYLRPCYFEAIIAYVYRKSKEALLTKLDPSLLSCSSMIRSLAVASVSFVGHVPGAGLAPLPPSIQLEDQDANSLAAGLPHFATGIWRNWGRDTFIALPGCLLATGRFNDARNIIVSFAGSMRHGLIPNLLAEGQGSRFNCRDAVWFWLVSIVKYVKSAAKGHEILSAPVRRIYPQDDTVFGDEEREQPLIDVMFEALQRHFQGISFRERNAGPQIDEHMKDEGFNLSVWVDRETGFVYGGNRWNCGTWMDKMGSSDKAGNRCEPATPRDGAAVELQGLAACALSAMADWYSKGFIKQEGVNDGSVSWSWTDWAERIRANFGRMFFVSRENTDEFVNRRGIVKDTVGSSLGYTDYQLRCNFAIALAVDPLLMDLENAWEALDQAKDNLLGPLGIKTLDPSDWGYNGYYNNDDDGHEKKTAKGWNYHQGPEWVWVAAFYLYARLAVGRAIGGQRFLEARKEVRARLGNYFRHIQESAWHSLPELTQENGIPCPASCPAQAWSIGCLLEVCQLVNASASEYTKN